MNRVVPDPTWKVAPTATWMLPSLQNATLPEASSDVMETDVPAPMGISSGVLKNLFNTLVVEPLKVQ